MKNILLLTALLGFIAAPAFGQTALGTIGPGAVPCAYTDCKVKTMAIGGATIGTDALAVTGTETHNGAVSFAANGAASASPVLLSGTVLTGGTATTNFPAMFVQPTGAAAVTSWNTSGTGLGMNLASGFGGNFLDFHVAGAGSVFSVDSAGGVVAARYRLQSGNTSVTSPAAASLQFGAADVDTGPVAQTTRTQGALAGGTSNVAGADWTFLASPGKGTGAGGSFIFQTTPAGSTGTVVGTPTTVMTITGPGAITMPRVTTGTNADFLCLSASAVVLLQTSACTISSARFKTEIKPYRLALSEAVYRMPVVTFRLKDGAKNKDPNAGVVQMGLIAENVAKIMPLCAIYENDMKTPKSYRQECLIAALVKTVQEQHAANDNLARRVAVLERRR